MKTWFAKDGLEALEFLPHHKFSPPNPVESLPKKRKGEFNITPNPLLINLEWDAHQAHPAVMVRCPDTFGHLFLWRNLLEEGFMYNWFRKLRILGRREEALFLIIILISD